jgi:EVE domain
MTKHWIAVASADHVAIGRAQGCMQVNHGKLGPLKRMSPGDGIAYYSPVQTCRTATKLQAFTAVGRIKEGAPYQGDMGGGFTPYRRDVEWFPSHTAPIAQLLDQLEFTKGKANWGYQMRLGVFEVSEADMVIVAAAMGCKLGE